MTAPLTTVLCVHAQSNDLKFLNPVRNRLRKLLGSRMIECKLTTRASHVEALLALKRATDGLVVILAHGTGDYLRGGENHSRVSGEHNEVEKFLTRADLCAFRDKAVFCMSCDSNGLARGSLDAGAIAFVGFDEIAFNRFDAAGNPVGSHTLVKHSQNLLADAVKATLECFVTGRVSLDESVEFLRLWINKNAVTYVRKMKSVKERREVAALFLRAGNGVQYHGQFGVRFFSHD